MHVFFFLLLVWFLVQGLAILKASLQSKNVLSDVFLHGNKKNAPGAGGRA
jgi:hypothetical protein